MHPTTRSCIFPAHYAYCMHYLEVAVVQHWVALFWSRRSLLGVVRHFHPVHFAVIHANKRKWSLRVTYIRTYVIVHTYIQKGNSFDVNCVKLSNNCSQRSSTMLKHSMVRGLNFFEHCTMATKSKAPPLGRASSNCVATPPAPACSVLCPTPPPPSLGGED